MKTRFSIFLVFSGLLSVCSCRMNNPKAMVPAFESWQRIVPFDELEGVSYFYDAEEKCILIKFTSVGGLVIYSGVTISGVHRGEEILPAISVLGYIASEHMPQANYSVVLRKNEKSFVRLTASLEQPEGLFYKDEDGLHLVPQDVSLKAEWAKPHLK